MQNPMERYYIDERERLMDRDTGEMIQWGPDLQTVEHRAEMLNGSQRMIDEEGDHPAYPVLLRLAGQDPKHFRSDLERCDRYQLACQGRRRFVWGIYDCGTFLFDDPRLIEWAEAAVKVYGDRIRWYSFSGQTHRAIEPNRLVAAVKALPIS